MTVNEWLTYAEKELRDAEVDSPRLDAQLIAAHVLNVDRTKVLSLDHELSDEQQNYLSRQLARRTAREPLAYIHGTRDFYGLPFTVNKHVLVPRPETEAMVEYLEKNCQQEQSVLELGTGSGAIAIALKTVRPDLNITATEISKSALEVARGNSIDHGTDIAFIESDLFDKIETRFDVIAANLPYVPTTARRQPEIGFEPDVALYGDEDGLAHYRKFFQELPDFMQPRGWFIIEASPTQFRELEVLSKAVSFQLEALSEYIFVGTRL